MFNASALLRYFDTHENLPHISKYHRESYKEHCLLVIEAMSTKTADTTLIIAACLHDIAKPRTQGLNKINEPCFYGHEEITDAELLQFLTPDDPRFNYVKALILCHMAPYHVQNAKDYDKALRKQCRKCLKNGGIELEVDDAFIHDLMLLHEADDSGSIRRDEDLPEIAERIERANIQMMDLA